MPSFSPAVDYPVGLGPSASVSGDFNADGFSDLAVANSGTNTVSVLLGNGDGTFQAPRHFGCGYTPNSIAVGDFNGDSRLDLATNDYLDSSVYLLLGNGSGTFQAARQFAAGTWTVEVAAGDFNGDGRLDLAVTGEVVNLLLGNGDGTFQAAREISRSGGDSLAVGEFNGDGHLDIAASYWVSDSEGAICLIDVLLGNGDGTFSGLWNVGAGSSPVLGDLDGDGRLDLVAVFPPNMVDYGTVCVMLGNGNGTFQWSALSVSGASTCALGDINGDGRLDIVTTNSVFDGVDVLLGDGAGHFPTIQTFSGSPGPTSAVVQDYCGDGFADVVVARSSANVVSMLVNDGVWPPPPLPWVGIGYEYLKVTEGNTGTRNANFTVTLTHACVAPVTVNFATADMWAGEATAGSDYQAASGILTFAPGEFRKTITVLVNGDRLHEPTESFVVRLSNPTNANLGNGNGWCAILDDDEPRWVSISDVTMKEGKNGKTTLFTFTVTLSAPYDQAVTMSFQTVNGTAKTSDNDYIARSGTLTFSPGETTKTITIEVKGDSKKEPNETFYVDLFGLSGNALFTKSRGVGAILNDD